MIPKGTRVLAVATMKGCRKSLPAANWIVDREYVTLLEDCPEGRTLDVVDVRRADGTEESVYSFNVTGEVL